MTASATAPVKSHLPFGCTHLACHQRFPNARTLGRHLTAIHGEPSKNAVRKAKAKTAKANKAKTKLKLQPATSAKLKQVQAVKRGMKRLWSDPRSNPVKDMQEAKREYTKRAVAHVSAPPPPTLNEAIAALELKVESMREVIDILKEMNK